MTRRSSPPARITAVVLAVSLLFATNCLAQELRGRVRQSYQQVDTDGQGLDSLAQNYELSFKNHVTQDLYWQARLRALVNGFNGEAGASPADTLLMEPFAQVVYEGRNWQLSGGGRLTKVSPRGDQGGLAEREREDLFGKVSLFSGGSYSADLSFSQIDLSEDRVDKSTENRTLLTAAFSRRVGGLSMSLENRSFTDIGTRFTRDSLQATGSGNMRTTLDEGRWIVNGHFLVSSGRTREVTPLAIDVETLRIAREGLFDIDTNPLSGSLTTSPALIDADFSAAAVDLSGEFRNIGVDMGFARNIDRFDVYVERRLLPGNGKEYRWDVYASSDGLFWTLVQKDAVSRFEDLRNRFEITFPRTRTRYAKVVNTSYSFDEPPLAVTEIEISGAESRIGKSITTLGQQSGNFGVAWRPAGQVDMSLHTYASRQTSDRGAITGTDEDLNSALTTTWRPAEGVVTSFRLQALNRNTELRPSEQDRLASVSLALTPMPTLDFALIGTHRKNRSLSRSLAQTNSLNFRTAARLLNETEAALDLGLHRQEENTVDRTTSRRSARVSLITTMRPDLIWSNNWAVERIETGGSAAFPARTDLDLRSRVSYRPTRVLGAAFEYFYQEIAGLTGSSRLYDLDWLPFPGGAVQLQFSLLQDRRSVTGSLRDELRAGARWTLNPRTVLESAYTVITRESDLRTQQRVVSVFLEYRF